MAISVRASAHKLRERARYMRPGYRLDAIAERLAGATALEPGGPSSLFERGGLVPVYPRLAALDVLDYAERTLWSAQAARFSSSPPEDVTCAAASSRRRATSPRSPTTPTTRSWRRTCWSTWRTRWER